MSEMSLCQDRKKPLKIRAGGNIILLYAPRLKNTNTHTYTHTQNSSVDDGSESLCRIRNKNFVGSGSEPSQK